MTRMCGVRCDIRIYENGGDTDAVSTADTTEGVRTTPFVVVSDSRRITL
jgi:hypothetical protein